MNIDVRLNHELSHETMETVDFFSFHFGLFWMLLYLVNFYLTIGQLIDQQKIYPII